MSSLSQPEWNPVYYHKADTAGIGFDRTATGSNAVSQYATAVGQAFGNQAHGRASDSLLFFHHVGWSGRRSTREERSGTSSCTATARASTTFGHMREAWATVKTRIDGKRFNEVTDFLQIQHYEARWWRDACLSYFATFSKLAIPAGYSPLQNPLSFYQGLTCPTDVKKPRCTQVYKGNPSPAVLP